MSVRLIQAEQVSSSDEAVQGIISDEAKRLHHHLFPSFFLSNVLQATYRNSEVQACPLALTELSQTSTESHCTLA